MTRDNYDGIGDWFRYYVTPPGGSEQYVGGLRFPRSNPSVPASYRDGAGSWIEFWDNNDPAIINGTSLPYPIPDIHIQVSAVANGNIVPYGVKSSYGATELPNNSNADIYAESPGGLVHMIVGHSSTRVHAA